MANFLEGLVGTVNSLLGDPTGAAATRDQVQAASIRGGAKSARERDIARISAGIYTEEEQKLFAQGVSVQSLIEAIQNSTSPSAQVKATDTLKQITEQNQAAKESVAGAAEAQKRAPGRRATMLNRSSQPNTLLTLMSDTSPTGGSQPVTLAKMRGY